MRRFSPVFLRATTAVCGLSLFLFGAARLRADFQGASYLVAFDDAPLNYSASKPQDAVAALQTRLEKGETKLQYEPQHGYLLSLLKQLNISQSSQMLVFSKTSLQREFISPQTPRALYFNDDVYVGFIPGAPLIEISVADPNLGGVFYTIEQKETNPELTRSTQCLECHASARTMGVPGHLVRSFVTDTSGFPDFSRVPEMVTHRMPLEERFGGWYITGTSGEMAHRGNLFGAKIFAKHEKDPHFGGNVTDLKTYFNTARYLTPHSDIVAQMVLDHQAHMHNFLARMHYEASVRAMRYGQVKYMDSIVDSFLKYLLFSEETPLTDTIKGTTNFAAEFAARGPKDKEGRSLRDFDLQTRLFKYPCSFLIYSDAFDALQPELKAMLYQKLFDILSGKNQSADFKNLTPESRRALLEILADTKTDLPDYWKK